MKKLLLILFLIAWTSLPSGYSSEIAYSGYINPISTEFTEDGQYMFVAEKKGIVWLSVWDGQKYVNNVTPILDYSEYVTSYIERGVLDFAYNNGRIYLYYTAEEDQFFDDIEVPNYATINRVTSFTTDLENNSSTFLKHVIGEELNQGIPSTDEIHNGGGLAFDSNGFLYISTGDGGTGKYNGWALNRGIIRDAEVLSGQWKSQLVNCLNGKILRVDPDTGQGIPGNPFYDFENPYSAESRVFVMGLRNPYRIDIYNDVIYVADVGAATWEEINKIDINLHAGVNCGWGKYEGFEILSGNSAAFNEDDNARFVDLISAATSLAVDPDLTQRRYAHFDPSLVYRHPYSINSVLQPPITRLINYTNGEINPIIPSYEFSGKSIIGGVVINDFGPDMNGAYVFHDWGGDELNVALPGEGRQFSDTMNLTADENDADAIVHIVQHPDGSLYLTNYFGKIYRIWYDDTLSLNTVISLESIPYGLKYDLFDMASRLIGSGITSKNLKRELPINQVVILKINGYEPKKYIRHKRL